jgi:hypothetical protein
MAEPPVMDAFETGLAGQVRRYTSVASSRPFDPLVAARAAMATSGTSGSSLAWRSAIRSRRWLLVPVPIAISVAVVAVAVGGILQRRPPEAVGGPVPDALRHSWSRPYGVAPGPDVYGSGFLALTDRRADYGREPGAAASTSSIASTGPAALEVTATSETKDCAPGDAGAYRWTLEGSDTVLTLTPISADACAARQTALAGQWVRDNFPPQPVLGDALPAGTHTTSTFDPLGDAGSPTHLEFTVPEGWRLMGDEVGSFNVQRLPDDPAGDTWAEPLIGAFTSPRLEADFAPGAACGPTGDAPGVEGGLDELVAAIVSRPGVVSTPPADVTIAGHQGRMLDLRLAPTWTGGCSDVSGPIVGMPILHQGGSLRGPVVGLGPDQPMRLFLLDLGRGRTLAIAIANLTDNESSSFEQHLAEAMPIVESFQFVPATP